MKESILKSIAIYDNGGQTLDRITVVLLQTKKGTQYDCICASQTGERVFQHSTCTRGRHLGKRIEFDQLNKELQTKLTNYFND